MGRMGDGAREGEDGGGEVARRRQDRASASARSTGGLGKKTWKKKNGMVWIERKTKSKGNFGKKKT